MRLFRQTRPGDWNDVFADISQVLRSLLPGPPSHTHSAEAHHELAITLRKQGKLVEAEAHCRQALRIRPDFADAHNNLGNALRLQGKLEEAAHHYRESLRLRPPFVEAHLTWARAHPPWPVGRSDNPLP